MPTKIPAGLRLLTKPFIYSLRNINDSSPYIPTDFLWPRKRSTNAFGRQNNFRQMICVQKNLDPPPSLSKFLGNLDTTEYNPSGTPITSLNQVFPCLTS